MSLQVISCQNCSTKLKKPKLEINILLKKRCVSFTTVPRSLIYIFEVYLTYSNQKRHRTVLLKSVFDTVPTRYMILLSLPLPLVWPHAILPTCKMSLHSLKIALHVSYKSICDERTLCTNSNGLRQMVLLSVIYRLA